MGVEIYTIPLQNGAITKCSFFRDNTLYNKVLSDATSTSSVVVVAHGSVSDVMNYLGNTFLKVPYGVPNDRVNTYKSNFLSLFHNYYAISASSSYVDSISTNGLFKGRYNYSNTYLNLTTGAGNIGDSPFCNVGGYASDGSSANFDYYGLVGNDFLDGIALVIEVAYYSSDGGYYQVRVRKHSGRTWRTQIQAEMSEIAATTLINYFENVAPDIPDPFGPGGYSGEDGGNGNFGENSDEVEADSLPDETNFGATACGLITIFHPSKDQLRRLASVLWADSFWNFVQNAIQNIGDLFISLGMVPFSITGGNDVEVTWFNYAVTGAASKTDVYLKLCEKQFMEFDMGYIALDGSDDRIFSSDSVLDYSPFSKLGIYLPFIGYQELDIDECRGQKVYLKYRIDILSGTTVALITLSSYDEDRTIYEFTGNCLTQLPLTSIDAQSLISNAVNIGIAIASAGATGAVASAGDVVTAERLANGDISQATAALQNAQHSAQVSNADGSLLSATANGAMGMKPNFKKSGAISASATLMAVKQPYLFLVTPRQSFPENYGHYCGYPSNIADVLGNFSGFTVVEDIRLNGLVATSPEVEEIYKLLKTGVII